MTGELDRPITRREFDEYKTVTDRALKMQATEYERRLRDLNGEQGRIEKIVQRTVTLEAFEDFKTLLDERVGALRMAEDKRTGALLLFRFMATAGVFGLILSVLNSLGVRLGA